MNWNRLLTAAVAVCCLVAVGTAATTLDSSVSTEPEEAVEFDPATLPVGDQSEVNQLRRQVSSADARPVSGAGSDDGVSERASDGDGSHVESTPTSRSRAGGDSERAARAQAERRQQSGGGGQDQQQQQQQHQRPEEPSLLERLLDLLRALLAALPAVLALLAFAGAAYLLYDRFGGRRGGDGGTDDGGPALGDPAPGNDVSRAWYEMVERAGLADRYDLTPDEHAARAADRGVDPDAAASLTRLFEEVRYGDAPVTDERRRRARERVQEIRAQARELRADGEGERR